jgi:predicted RND superfamily exporter protein
MMSRIFAWLQRHRWLVIAVYAVLVPIAAVTAKGIPSAGSIEQLIVPGDPDVVATHEFHQLFPEPKIALLVIEEPDPWSPAAIARVDRVTHAVAGVPHVRVVSPLDVLRRARPGASPEELRALALGTDYFQRQGLVGDHFTSLVVALEVEGAAERDATLAAIHAAVQRASTSSVHEVGSPYVDAWLEHASATGSARSFAVFGVLLVVVTLFLYRSARALLAVMIALGSAVTLAVAAGGLLGFSFTIVSALVPLTVMVTTLATLNYLHLRFVDRPRGMPVAEHQIVALRNKLVPVTASTLAAAMGFAALAISAIRPIREMGLWTAVGLLVACIVAYTLFPALELVLRTPSGRRAGMRSALYDRAAQAIPVFSYRHRHVLVAGALAACVAGVLAVATMPTEVDPLVNIDPSSRVYQDHAWFRDHVNSLGVAHVWIHLPSATATDPAVLQAIDHLDSALEMLPQVAGVTGPTTVIRMRSYFAGHGRAPPADPQTFADVEQLVLAQPELRGFIDASGLADLQLTVLARRGGAAGYGELDREVRAAWQSIAQAPALAGARMRVVGESVLEAKVGESLVPTLAQSLLITAVCILAMFLVVTRSATERLLAMLPSAFALLVTFLGLRLLGGTLNIATLIIAATVLGATENDQLHFFHHMHERRGASLEERLRHTLRIAGRPIAFATIIQATGFLSLSLSHFPPMRQFGFMTAAAFVLAMLADFTVLPAALWLASRERPALPRVEAQGGRAKSPPALTVEPAP